MRERYKMLLRDLLMREVDECHHRQFAELKAYDTALTPMHEGGKVDTLSAVWKRTLEEFPIDQPWAHI